MSSDKLDVFLARVAHDLKAPIRQMNNMVQLLTLDTEFSDSQMQVVNMLDGIAEKGMHKLEGLSYFAQQLDDDGSRVQIDLATAIERLARDHPGLRIDGLDQIECSIEFNAHALDNILHEILSNARLYAPSGAEPCLYINANSDDTGKVTRLDFSNESIGVSFEQVEKLLAPFARDAKAEQIDGYGMGLSVVQFLAARAGGEVSLSCEDKRFGLHWNLAAPQTGALDKVA